MGGADTKQRPEVPMSGAHAKGSYESLEESGRRDVDPALRALETSVRAALELALERGDRISVALRGDLARGIATRVIEGTVIALEFAADGRERLRLAMGEDVEQRVLLQ